MENQYSEFYNSTGICTDTRKISKDCLFICIKGENFDGNTFASPALEQGAGHVVVDNPEYYIDNGKMTLVGDSVEYLQKLANYHRNKFSIPVIGITGSNGKTSTKELINAVLSEKYNVLATEGNLNNHLGVPFTLLRLNESHEIAIIEMGANKFKDIEELSNIAEPTHGIITNIGKAHLEGFLNFEGVLKTKKELYTSVANNKGTIFYNLDDEILVDNLPPNTTTYSYGEDSRADISGELVALTPFVEMKWSSESFTSEIISTNIVGKYNFYNFLAAIAIGHFFGVENHSISHAISNYTPTNNRSQVKKTESNTLILDCYNANPTSMKSALESFSAMSAANKLAILGDMKELGADTEKEHLAILSLAKKNNLDCILVGEAFQHANKEFGFKSTTNTSELIDLLKSNPILNSLILLKGSRSIGLEKLENEL